MSALSYIRAFSYFCLGIFSIVELGLTGSRLHYTEHLAPGGDILTLRSHFYDPIVVELLVTSVLTLFWAFYAFAAIIARWETKVIASYTGEVISLFGLFVMWIVGASIASDHSHWGDLNSCHGFRECRILTALVAFAWINFIWVFVHMLVSVGLGFAKKFAAPFHGRNDTPKGETF